jgi:hypothetical protein
VRLRGRSKLRDLGLISPPCVGPGSLYSRGEGAASPTGGDQLKGLYSFIEDFRRDGKSATEVRRATFSNGWVQNRQGRWDPLLKARFTASGATWEAKETIDAGVVKEQFYLQTGGDTRTTTPLETLMERPAGNTIPPQLPED